MVLRASWCRKKSLFIHKRHTSSKTDQQEHFQGFDKSHLLRWGEVILCLVTLVLLWSVLRLSVRYLKSFMIISWGNFMSHQWQTATLFWIVTFCWFKKLTLSTLGDKRTQLGGSKPRYINRTDYKNYASHLISAVTFHLLILELRAHLFFSKVTHACLVLGYVSSYLTSILSSLSYTLQTLLWR